MYFYAVSGVSCKQADVNFLLQTQDAICYWKCNTSVNCLYPAAFAQKQGKKVCVVDYITCTCTDWLNIRDEAALATPAQKTKSLVFRGVRRYPVRTTPKPEVFSILVVFIEVVDGWADSQTLRNKTASTNAKSRLRLYTRILWLIIDFSPPLSSFVKYYTSVSASKEFWFLGGKKRRWKLLLH